MRKLIILSTLLAALFTSCSKEKSEEIQDPLLQGVKEQFMKDYPNSINPTWSIVDDKYAVVQFMMPASTKAPRNVKKEVWYNGFKENNFNKIKDNTKYDKESVSIIPQEVKDAFNLTNYADVAVWTIDEIVLKECRKEVEGGPDQFIFTKVYVYEVDNVEDKNLEAKVIIDAETHQVVFSKEYQDEDDDNDKETVLEQKLIDEINMMFLGYSPVILDIEINGRNGHIEVEGTITSSIDGKQDFKVVFNKNYKVIAADSDHKTIFSKLDEEFQTKINNWFDLNVTENPIKPAGDTRVKQKKGIIIKNGVTYMMLVEFELAVNKQEVEYVFGFTDDREIRLIEKEIDD